MVSPWLLFIFLTYHIFVISQFSFYAIAQKLFWNPYVYYYKTLVFYHNILRVNMYFIIKKQVLYNTKPTPSYNIESR